MRSQIIIGSRGSDLALWQSNYMKRRLEALYPALSVSIVIIKTTGDKIIDSPLSVIGGKGAFTAELEEALIAKEVDIAVHSLKDLPTEIHSELTIAAIPEREDVRDALLGKYESIEALPKGATVATGSLRRKAQLLAKRSDLTIIDIRGNVPTRIKKLADNGWDAMLLASAGLVRLSLTEHIKAFIPTDDILPAPGQGALAIECRKDDAELISLLQALDDKNTRLVAEHERLILHALGGGCQMPLGTYASINGDTIELSACIANTDGTSLIRKTVSTTSSALTISALSLADDLLNSGGTEILRSLQETLNKS